MPVERQNDVTGLDRTFLGGAILRHARDQSAARMIKTQAFRDFLGNVLNPHA